MSLLIDSLLARRLSVVRACGCLDGKRTECGTHVVRNDQCQDSWNVGSSEATYVVPDCVSVLHSPRHPLLLADFGDEEMKSCYSSSSNSICGASKVHWWSRFGDGAYNSSEICWLHIASSKCRFFMRYGEFWGKEQSLP